MKIGRLDLSAFQLPEDLGIRGIAASNGLTITGKSVRSLPALHGEFSLRDGLCVKGQKEPHAKTIGLFESWF